MAMMNKLREFFSGMAQDKRLHLAAGAIAGVVGAMLGGALLGVSGFAVFVCGVMAAAVAGSAKEAYDYITDGVIDRLDAAYTAVGGVPTAALIALFA
jgi:ABC-type transport system involved in cytochrome bd biosynthesis fused ATPase/permease subunit